MSAGAAAGAAAAAAAAQQARMREEEEVLTTYKQGDLDGWEFKIVRSSTRISSEKFRQLCTEESQNGWELVEKFDDYRVRFKRPVERRSYDGGQSGIDPYRTQFGISDVKLVLLILGGVFGAIGAFIAIMFAVAR